MISLSLESGSRLPRQLDFACSPVQIGSAPGCHIPLSGWRVANVHARIEFGDGGAHLVDEGSLSGVRVNGQRVRESEPILPGDLIELAGHRIRVLGLPTGGKSGTKLSEEGASEPFQRDTATSSAVSKDTLAVRAWKRRMHGRLLETLDLRRRDLRDLDPEVLRREVRDMLEALLGSDDEAPAGLNHADLIEGLLDEALGFGPLERLLEDPSISEIMVNAADDIWIERGGRLHRHAAAFSDDDAVRNVIDRIVAPLGRRIDEASPMVDARLPDGSRVNAVIPPLAVRGPALTIRRFNRNLLGVDDLRRMGSASAQVIEFLKVCIEHRRNIVISGGTGSGKTTLLNVLSNLIGSGERLITIEDSAELSLQHEHLVQLEARPANMEGRGEITIRDLVRNALRMRPDRIIVGECRGGETLDMLQAMNTGHDGSLTTVHANGAREVAARLEVMTLMAGVDLPITAIREQIAQAVDVVVHQARYPDGSRRIASVIEITGTDAGRIQMLELFRHDPAGGSGACDAIPTFYESLRARGASLDLSIFSASK